MSGTISGQVVVQDSIRKQGEQFMRSKSVASTPAWPERAPVSSSLPGFCSCLDFFQYEQ